MNSREEQFAEFVYECVAGHKPRNEFERSGVLELRKVLRAEFNTPEYSELRKKISDKLQVLRKSLSDTLQGPDKETLRRHL